MREICRRCLDNGIGKFVEPAYSGLGRELCEDCQCDVWAGLRIRGKLTRIQRLQPPNDSPERPAILPPVEAN